MPAPAPGMARRTLHRRHGSPAVAADVAAPAATTIAVAANVYSGAHHPHQMVRVRAEGEADAEGDSTDHSDGVARTKVVARRMSIVSCGLNCNVAEGRGPAPVLT